ncbi:MAG: hypothetical protein JXA90_11375 [Planctomycetes bacterium]|nr:hypothetical protein [Planctomycetota bacterium]
MNTSSIAKSSALMLLGAVLFTGCRGAYPRQDPTGRRLPTVRGQRLDGQSVTLPDDLGGKPALLLVAYKMNSQFDCDRWILGVLDAALDVAVLEVPTIQGLVPGLFAGSIDAGMRSGIPAEEWAQVVTVYDDAEILAEFLGSENALPARALLLDPGGSVVFFHDEGYSPRALKRLAEALEKIRGERG